MRTLQLACLLLLLLLGCSTTPGACPEGRELKDGFCTRVACAAGERLVDGACVAIACPAGATLQGDTCSFDDETPPVTTASPGAGTYAGAVDVQLVADEPAVIFYTLDGSEPDDTSPSGASPVSVTVDATADLRFFAVDAAGNEEGEKTLSYVIDSEAPGDISGLTATIGPPDVDLSWTNPAIIGGVLVVRGRAEPLGWQPQNGVTYQVGEIVAPGVTVISTAEITSLNDPTPWGDISTYALWAFDDVLNYSANAATAAVTLPVPRQPMTVTVDLTDGTLDATSPPDMGVSVGVELTPALDAMNLVLDVTNLTPSPMYSIKAIFTNVSAGTVEGTTPYDGDPAVYFGANALGPGSSFNRKVSIAGIPNGTTNITIELELATHPLVITSGFKSGEQITMNDSSFGNFAHNARFGFFEGYQPQNNRGGLTVGAALSPDGLRLYATAHNMPEVKVFDLETMEQVLSSGNLGGLGTPPTGGARMAMSPDGQFVYVTLTDAIHGGQELFGCTNRPDGNCPITNVHLVKLNADDLTEVGRLTLESNINNTASPSAVGMAPAVSPDGTRVAVPVDLLGRLHFVDATTMQSVWGISTTTNRPRAAAIKPDNGVVYLHNKNAELSIVNTSTQVETQLTGTGFGGTSDHGSMQYGPDGMLYVTRFRNNSAPAPGVLRIDTSDNTIQPFMPGSEVPGIGFVSDNLWIIPDAEGANMIRMVNPMTFAEIAARPVGVTVKGHFAVVTPKPLWHPN